MNKKENFLQSVYFKNPDYVPMTNEDILYIFTFDDIVKRENWRDRWGIEWKLEIEDMVPFPKGNPLDKIEKLEGYEFPDPDGLVLDEKVKYEISKVDRDKKLIIGNLPYLLFERAWALMGLENFMMALIDYPKACKYMLHKIASYAKKVFERYMEEYDVDGIKFSEDLGSQKALMISPVQFREFLLPEYEYIFENVIKEKKIIFFHSCGCVEDIAGDLASIGVTILNPIQASANNIEKIKRDTCGKMALYGAISTDLILRGTPEEVREETIRVLETLKPGGGYVCGPDQGFPYFPEENIKMLWKTAKEYGVY